MEIREAMQKTVDQFAESIRCIRGSTISPALLDSVKIVYYGQTMNLCSLALTRRVDNGISIEPYDDGTITDINKQLNEQGFKSYLYQKGKLLINVSPPTGEQKQEIIKHIRKLGEEAKIAIRQIRRNYRDGLKPVQREEQDEKIQTITDQAIFSIDDIIQEKINWL